jgi:SSS family solute:Na+ symporter
LNEMNNFGLQFWDYFIFTLYIVILSGIGWWVGRKKKEKSEDYFLAGRTLPWYVVGSSFICSNISTEHFIGMIGAAFIYGMGVAMWEWGNINSFTVLIWFFIPFLLASKVYTTPEFLEKRFGVVLRQFFAIVTVICNVVAFLAAVLYGGAIALHGLFGWDMWVAIILLGGVGGSWAIYGGLRSVAWTDVLTVIIMVAGGLTVTILGLYSLSDSGSLFEGWRIMIDRNMAQSGIWAQAVVQNAQHIVREDSYNRMSVIQPITHEILPWPSLVVGFLASGIWYSVLNQFMIQRVLGAKNVYHARMGIVLAGYLKILMPFIVVVPGLILFAKYPQWMLVPWNDIKPQADTGYIHMLKTIVPVGLRGLFLAALFGAIQSTVNAVLNSTATVWTNDIYKRLLYKNASEKHLVRVGIASSIIILVTSIVLGRYIGKLGGSLFEYIQTLYAFFAPPFAAVFVLGIFFRRINVQGATIAVFAGFIFSFLLKFYVQFVPGHYKWVEPFGMQSILAWAFSVIVCVGITLLTPPPRPEQVTDTLTFNWHKINIFNDLGDRWYTSVVFWWGLFALIVVLLVVIFSGIVFHLPTAR